MLTMRPYSYTAMSAHRDKRVAYVEDRLPALIERAARSRDDDGADALAALLSLMYPSATWSN